MVEFSKQYESQIVPEWTDAFVDYCRLKLDLERILLVNNVNTSSNSNTEDANTPTTLFSSLRDFVNPGHSLPRRDHAVIHVRRKLVSSASVGDEYETEVQDWDAAKEFFTCLDEELNKVNRFYRAKEEEFLDRGVSLKKQIEILSKLSGILTSTESESLVELLEARKKNTGYGKSRLMSSQNFNCLGKDLGMSIPLTTPSLTMSAIGHLLWEDVISPSSKKCTSKGSKTNINRTDLHRASMMIRKAFVELYKGLGYLNTYRNLNMLAFIEILKKFDKVTGGEILPVYLKVVESSYFNNSNKVINLGDEVEEIFVKHFAGEDRRKAMKYLNPLQRKESHGKTFLVGLFTGCLIALLTGYVTMAHVTGTYRPLADPVYMETIYPVLSVFSLLFLHFFLYGCDILAWKNARVNYSFIFQLVPTKDLKYRDVFLACAISMVVVFGVLFAHLSLLAKGYSYEQVQAIPGLLLLGFLLVLVCPLNVFCRSSRSCFLRVIRNIVLSPMYKVVMLDFFMADQLCSQVPMIRNLEYITCYYATGSYKNQDYGYCMKTKYYRDLAYAVSFLPYYWRAMQCARKWFDVGKRNDLVNLGKYVSAMLAAGAKVAYERQQSNGWLCLVVIVSSASTIYHLYWDYVKDWGLLQPDSRNPWLRNELMLRQKTIYYISMGLNFVLRLAWMQTVLHGGFKNIDYRVTGLFLAALEVIRRGIWNFYRLENEHLNNAGKFRAVTTVPLPFHEGDEEED